MTNSRTATTAKPGLVTNLERRLHAQPSRGERVRRPPARQTREVLATAGAHDREARAPVIRAGRQRDLHARPAPLDSRHPPRLSLVYAHPKPGRALEVDAV